jgi:hypothetical protein
MKGGDMIPKHRQRDWKIAIAAYVRHLSEKTGDGQIDILLDIDNLIRPVGDSVWNYWSNDGAFRDFLTDNRDAITEVRNEIADSDEEYVKAFFRRYIYGGEIKEGGSGQVFDELPDATKEPSTRTEHEPDARFKRREDTAFVADCLHALLAEAGVPADPRFVEKWSIVIMAGKQ